MDMKIAGRIGKLLAKAEGTGSVEEAATFAAAAQKLAAQHSIDLAVARYLHTAGLAAETPEERKLDIGKARTLVLPFRIRLWREIATANDLRWSVASDKSYVHPIGFPSDLDAAFGMYAALADQMDRLADAWIAAGEWESHMVPVESWDYRRQCPMTHLVQVDSKTARRSFLAGFVDVVAERLAAVTAEARDEAATATATPGDEHAALSVTALALRAKTEQVEQARAVAWKARGVRGRMRAAQAFAGSVESVAAGRIAGQGASMSQRAALSA